MSVSYEKMTQGATFRFLVGQNLKSMTVHADAVAQQSDALRKLVFGDMREAKEREAKWDDVEEATFARFAQFIYTGQYTPADAIIISSSAGARINKEAFSVKANSQKPANRFLKTRKQSYVFPTLEHVGENPRKRKREQTSRVPRFTDLTFKDLNHYIASHQQPHIPLEIAKDRSRTEDFTSVFLCHAQLYVLADRWGIETLKNLAIQKLHRTLGTFTPLQARCADVIEAVNYTYGNTPTRPETDLLRGTLVNYIVWEAIDIAESEECLNMVENCGAFARDLMEATLKKLRNPRKPVQFEAVIPGSFPMF